MDLDLNPTSLLLAAAVTFAVGICLPDVLFLVGLTRIKRGILGGPDDALCEPGAIVTPQIAQQLAYLGFEPAGIYWEQMSAHKLFREAIFVSRNGDCFAAVYRLFNNDPPRVAFKTAFADGAYVLTQNYLGGMEAKEATFWAGGVEDAPLIDVVAEHRRRTQLFELAGHAPVPALTIEDHVEAEWTYMEHPVMRSAYYGTVKTLFGMKVGFLLGVPLLLTTCGVGLVGVGLISLAQSLGMLIFRYYGAMVERLLPAEESG
jgi:hypothetical protein